MTTTASPSTTGPSTTGPSTGLSTAVEQAWAKLRDVRARKRDLETQEKELSAQLRSELGRGEFIPSDGPGLTIFATKRFDSDLAARILPADLLAEVQRTVVDAKLLKAKLAEKGLPEQLYEMCQVEGDKDTVREMK